MPRLISLAARTAFNAAQTSELPIVLVAITHPDLADPILLSSDPTERFSLDPLRYGTTHDGDQYIFVMMQAVLPDDRDGAPAAAHIMLEATDYESVAAVRSISSPAEISFKQVLASDPESIELEYSGLQAISAGYDANSVSLEVSREPLSRIVWPYHLMTQRRFPGLFR